MEKNGQTVCVLDEQDAVIGYTYPKRAKGLVKKRRAEFVSDEAIRLCRQCPTYENMEDRKMDNNYFITVNPKTWRRNPDGGSKTIFDCFMISNPLAGAIASAPSMIEVLSLGGWNAGVSYATNGFQELKPDTEYHFVFWLNGGENDRGDETCLLEILFTDNNIAASNNEFDKGLRFRLNRGYIKPLKKYKGWEYYDIPFTTTQARYTQLQFVAGRAPMALMNAGEPDVYRDLQDVIDPYEKQRPQRHNIIFEDGWPVNRWYSTKNLTIRGKNTQPSSFYWFDTADNATNKVIDDMDIEAMQKKIREAVMNELDIDALRNEIMNSFRSSFNPSN